MSKTGRPNYRRGERGTRKRQRHIIVRGLRHDSPDLQKLSRAVIAMALREAEAETEARAATNGDIKGSIQDEKGNVGTTSRGEMP